MPNVVPSVKKLHNCSNAIETSIKIKDTIDVSWPTGSRSSLRRICQRLLVYCHIAHVRMSPGMFSVQYGGEPFAWSPKIFISIIFVLFIITETHTYRKHESGKSWKRISGCKWKVKDPQAGPRKWAQTKIVCLVQTGELIILSPFFNILIYTKFSYSQVLQLNTPFVYHLGKTSNHLH